MTECKSYYNGRVLFTDVTRAGTKEYPRTGTLKNGRNTENIRKHRFFGSAFSAFKSPYCAIKPRDDSNEPIESTVHEPKHRLAYTENASERI